MATLAVLGMGLLGAGFAQNLLEKGHTVRVWNRTASKCEPLRALGAEVAASPADAVRGAERVHLVLAEDFAVDAVIDALGDALGADVPVIDHSTNLPEKVAARFPRLRGLGIRYLHAPVFMAPANAREATGLMLIAGPEAEITALTPALNTMTGKVWNSGEAPERAASLKIVGNGMLVGMSGVMGDLFRVGAGGGLSEADVLGLFEVFVPTFGRIGKRVLAAADADASFELSMARKDTRLMIDTATPGLTVLPAIAARMDEMIADGQGAKDYAIFAAPSPSKES